jgi:TolB-like protein/class 3 adenylate cyclase/Tfp pilus assembly protein PilF
MTHKRQLAAIMFCDIVGYTAMMQEDEGRAMRARRKFKQALENIVGNLSGRIIQHYGDGALSIFNSASQAVKAAVEIQCDMRLDEKVPLRIGLHSGDITYDDEGAYGDSVNIASRIESLSVAGAVMISDKVYDEIKNQQEFQTISMGVFQLKNVKRPYEVFAISNNGIRVPAEHELKGKVDGHAPNKSVAVLAFKNMSHDPEQDYFGEGIAEEIINSLAQLKDLKVAGRTSAFHFKNKEIDLRDIGKQLNVRTILEGSVRKAGNRIRITAQLIDTKDGFHLWSERYDRELEDIFAIQDEIALAIVDKLKITLLKEDTEGAVQPPTVDMKAYQLFLKGRVFIDQRGDGVIRAEKCFKEALKLDPAFAMAHAGLGYVSFYKNVFMGYSPDEYLKAREAAQKAIQLDSNLADANLVLGIVHLYYDRDYEACLYRYKRAKELNPSSAEVYRVFSYYYSVMGKHKKAFKYVHRALELDPLNLNIQISVADLNYRARQYNLALETAKKILESAPVYRYAHFVMGQCYYKLGDFNRALNHLQDSEGMAIGKGTAQALMAACHHKLDQNDKVRERENELKKLDTTAYLSPVEKAQFYLGIEEKEKAYQMLELSIAARDITVVLLHVDPFWDQLREEARFQKILRSLNFRV